VKFSKELKVGILVTSAIAALLWGMNYLKGIDVFTGLNTYYSVYPNVDGLSPSSGIYMSGVKIGQVQKIEFFKDNSGRILATYSVKSSVFISKSSSAKIISTDLLGGRAISIQLDTKGEQAVDGDTLKGEVQTSLADQVMPVKDKAESLISSLDSIAISFNEVLGASNKNSISKTLANLESASGSIDNMLSADNGKLKKMIDNMESITANIKNNNESLSIALKNISAITDSLAKSNLAATINNANSTLKEAAAILDKINKGEGTIGMLINNDSLYNALENSASNLDKLLIDLKENPKRYVHVSVFGGKSK
jgi:phospholipid/cholesterol/gamma-HCH transport system substrate-binding protein